MKVKTYDGRDLKGWWEISFKIDGIQCRRTEDGWVSKSGKKTLHGLKNLELGEPGDIFEYYTGSWEKSSAIRRYTYECNPLSLYCIWPNIDVRLYHSDRENPTPEFIYNLLRIAIDGGVEGLMFRQGDIIYRVKPTETYDVLVTDIYEGKGKHTGRMGYYK